MDRINPGGKASMLNRAAEAQPKSGAAKPAADTKRAGGAVGNETKANMKGALFGSPTDSGNSLSGAMRELGSQHPEAYDALGPHHGGNSHVRHVPYKLG